MKIPIVDLNDEIIDYKDRSLLSEQDIYRVSALWITNSANQCLLAKRAKTKSNDPGKWGPAVAGTVEYEESYEKNVHKEAYEEIGLQELSISTGPKVLINGPKRYFCQWYLCTVDKNISNFVIQTEEVDCLQWFDMSDLKKQLQNYPDLFIVSFSKTVELFTK